eukprot:s1070_g8.t1
MCGALADAFLAAIHAFLQLCRTRRPLTWNCGTGSGLLSLGNSLVMTTLANGFKSTEDVLRGPKPSNAFDPRSAEVVAAVIPRYESQNAPKDQLYEYRLAAGPLPPDASPACCAYEFSVRLRFPSEFEMYHFVAMLRRCVRVDHYQQASKMLEYQKQHLDAASAVPRQRQIYKSGGQLEVAQLWLQAICQAALSVGNRDLFVHRRGGEPSSEEEQQEQQELGDITHSELTREQEEASSSRSMLLKATPKAKPGDSRVLKVSSKGAPKPKKRPTSAEARPEGSAAASLSSSSGSRPSNLQWISQFPSPGTHQPTEVVDLTSTDLEIASELHPSVKAYLWAPNQQTLVRVEGDLPKLRGSAIVYDWHQVLDTDRISKWRTEWVDDSGTVPHRHQGTLLEISHLCQQSERPVSIVICSHIESSSKNLERLIYATEQSRLPVSLVLVTDNRTGVRGKYQALKAVVKGFFLSF